MSKTAIRVLLHDQTIGYHPILARIGGGAAEGVLLRQLLHWDGVMSNARGHEWDGWFWKVAEEIYDETGMSRSEFETARTNLIKRGLIEYKARGVPNRAHYRVDLDKIEEALENSADFQKQYARKAPKHDQDQDPDASAPDTSETPANWIAENGQTSLPKTDKLDSAKPTNQFAENRQTIHENTSRENQEKNKISDAVFLSLRETLKGLFIISPEFDWEWLKALVHEIDDLELMTQMAHNYRAQMSRAVSVNPTQYAQMVRNAYARKQFLANRGGAP